MKLARWGEGSGIGSLAAEVDGCWYDLLAVLRNTRGFVTRYGEYEESVQALKLTSRPMIEAIPWLCSRPVGEDSMPPPLDTQRVLASLRAPLWGDGLIYCAAVNYHSHALESGALIQSTPLFFIKPFRCIIGPGANVELPVSSRQPDYEAELAVVIGKRGKAIPREAALDHVAGYTILNDISFRDLQSRNIPGRSPTTDWVRGKALDTAAPVGPWIVTTDEVADPQQLGLRLWVDGELRQDGNTSDMVFPIADLIASLSQDITLEPGDVIATGTCSGVGKYRGQFLAAGCRIEIAIEDVGMLSHGVVAQRA